MRQKYNSITRTIDGHVFNKQFIKAVSKEDSRTFGMKLQNSSKYRSYRIKKKRACK